MRLLRRACWQIAMKRKKKDVSNAKGGKAESCSIVKDVSGRLVQGEDEARKECTSQLGQPNRSISI